MADKLYVSETPEEVKNAQGLHLLTASTGNGQTVQILLEELAEKYGFRWTATLINIFDNEQKNDWFLRLNPNGRIPVLIDNSQSPPFTVHESAAELLYLLKLADKEHEFGFEDGLEHDEMLQWLLFWHGSGGPYQGQAIHFTRATEKIKYAIDRFRNETLRVFGVLEIRLSGKYTGEPRDYLAGKGKGKYSIADIRTFPWVNVWEMSGFTRQEMEAFPSLLEWINRIAKRPAVQIALGSKYKPS
ncbi:hypothetical protein DL764_001153 [Monosporascus ibericus]|uniref:GST N-terminal domain-containing protein n=1 Tax=Monosporascus ibericus TaxID=155417 RepID=A0A4Q4TQM2_9PEZI|nr:hypothetical protein DL764_001153 [Monosporascus ibericus]